MPEICYLFKKFRSATLGIIVKANDIIAEYQAQGFCLTLRQIYYQMITRDLFPESWIDLVYNAKHGLPPGTKNTLKNYKRLGDILNDGRLAGLIDWEAIEDRTRALQSNPHWSSPGQIVRACARGFRFDLWSDQDHYCEVWIEKEALAGVIEGICTELDVPFFACKGYTSQSEMWVAAQRLIKKENAGKETIIFHLGDHDPSGIDMTRDITDRLELFESTVEVRRIALSMSQIDKYNPPPNPAKPHAGCALKNSTSVASHPSSSIQTSSCRQTMIDALVLCSARSTPCAKAGTTPRISRAPCEMTGW